MLQRDRLARQYLQFVTAHPRRVIAIVLAITSLFVFAARHQAVINNTELWLPQGDPYVVTTHVIEEVFGGKDVVVIGVTPVQGDIYQPMVLQKIARLQERIRMIPEALPNNVVSLAARKVKSIRGTVEGMEVHPMLATVPKTATEIALLKESIAANPFYVGALVSADRRHAAIIAEFRLKKDATGFAALNAAIHDAVEQERDPAVKLHVAGAPVSFAGIEHYTMTAGAYFAVAFLVIMLVQYCSFRSMQGVLLPMLTASLSVLWGIGVLSLAGFKLDVLNTTTPILIMAITSGHAIQLLKRYYEEYERLAVDAASGHTPAHINKVAVIESLLRVGLVMVGAGMIAAICFFSLGFAHIDMVRRFGLFAGAGVLSGLLLELSLVPALRSLLPAPRRKPTSKTSPGPLDRILHVCSALTTGKRAKWVLIAGVVGVLGLGVGIFRLHVDNSTLLYFSPDHPIRVDDRAINKAFGGTNTVYFLVEGEQADSMKDPRVLVAMEKLQAFLDAQPEVGKTQSLADLVKRMNRAMHNDDAAQSVIPPDQDTVAQYLFLYSMSGAPQDFDNYVDTDYRKSLVWAFVKTDSTAYFKRLVEKVQPILAKEFPPGVKVRVGGTLAEMDALNDSIVKEKITNTAQMALVILVLTSLMLRSVIGGLFVVIPVLIIVVANFGMMGWLGIPLDMGTATTASMAIGIGADYEIYLLLRFREELGRTNDVKLASERTLQTSGKAILFISLALIGGYAVLFSSDFVFYSRLAGAVLMTMAISALSAILFLRAMILVVRPRFMFGLSRQQTLAGGRMVEEG